MRQPPFDITWVIQNLMHSTGTLCVVIDASSRSLDDMYLWPYHDKHEMKYLGGTLIQMKGKLIEMIILGISKMVEDLFNNLIGRRHKDLKIWSSELDGLRHTREVRWIRNLGNVIKHNNSFISTASKSKSCISLVTHFGTKDETPIDYLPEFCLKPLRETMLRYVYYAYVFSFDLLNHLDLRLRQRPEIEHDAIPDYMLDQFVRDLPGHPESPKVGQQNER